MSFGTEKKMYTYTTEGLYLYKSISFYTENKRNETHGGMCI